MAVSWAWEDLNLRLHPDRKTDRLGMVWPCFHAGTTSPAGTLRLKRKSPVYQLALPHESRAWPGRPIFIPRGGPGHGGLIDAIGVAAGHPLGELVPMPGWGDRARPVFPVLGGGLAEVVQLLGVLGHLVDLADVLAAGLPVGAQVGVGAGWAELVRLGEGER